MLLLAMKTGWPEKDILLLPDERLDTYIDELSEMYGDKGILID